MLATPAKMQKMTLSMLAADAQIAAKSLAKLSVVHLSPLDESHESFKAFPAENFHTQYHNLKSRYKKIIKYIEPVHSTHAAKSNYHPEADLAALEVLNGQVKTLWIDISAREEDIRKLNEELSTARQQMQSLERYLQLDIDLSRIGRKNQFLSVLSGSLPAKNMPKIKQALSLSHYLIDTFYQYEGLNYVLVAGASSHQQEVQEVLKSAEFKEIEIPAEFSASPNMVRQDLAGNIKQLERQIETKSASILQHIADHQTLLNQTHAILQDAMPYAGIAQHLKGQGRLVVLQGWVPETQIGRVRQSLEHSLKHAFLLNFSEPEFKDYSKIPSLLKSNKLTAPFQLLIKQYGVPQYGEIDPANLFTFSYVLMFGMMFGDIGHGFVILLAAFLLRKKLPAVAIMGSMAGLSSMLFGFLYGSFFGFEEIIHPLWMSPMADPQFVLFLALLWGIGFLVIANALSIRNLFALGHTNKALFSPQGMAGLFFYLSIVLYLLLAQDSGESIFHFAPWLAVICMLVMLWYQWHHASGKLFERVLVVTIEGLEIVISNTSATLSFLRVAAFALNHIALSAAVFAIATMMDSFGHIVTIILGNIFVIVLEGAIVAIQCLRLEYYEGFSRFFSGQGKPFKPLTSEPI